MLIVKYFHRTTFSLKRVFEIKRTVQEDRHKSTKVARETEKGSEVFNCKNVYKTAH